MELRRLWLLCCCCCFYCWGSCAALTPPFGRHPAAAFRVPRTPADPFPRFQSRAGRGAGAARAPPTPTPGVAGPFRSRGGGRST